MRPSKRIIAVASGKGGVGKTTVSVNLAVALADAGYAVGLADADLYGPDVPLMFGLTRRVAASGIDVWEHPRRRRRLAPVEALGVKLFSTQFLMSEDQAFAVQGTFATMLLQRLLGDVDWGDLDVLLVDLPPGTADLQQAVAGRADLSGAIVVVTPQDVAHLDARKLVAMLRASGVEILGGVENMAPMDCPCCGTPIALYPEVAPDRSIWSEGVARLVTVPFTPPRDGSALLVQEKSPASDAFRELARQLGARLASG